MGKKNSYSYYQYEETKKRIERMMELKIYPTINVLRIFSNSKDNYDRIWVDLVCGIEKRKLDKIALVMNEKVCRYLILALQSALQNKKFKNVKGSLENE